MNDIINANRQVKIRRIAKMHDKRDLNFLMKMPQYLI